MKTPSPQHGICPHCGADRSGPSAEAHDKDCPEAAAQPVAAKEWKSAKERGPFASNAGWEPVAANPPTQVDPTVNTETATGSNCVNTDRSTGGASSQGAAPLATPTITLTPMSNLPPEQMTAHSGTVNGAGLANPKVEEATEKICSKFWQLNNDHFRREIAAILGPFFSPVSQPPTEDGRRYCKHCTNRIYFDCVSDPRNPKWRHAGSNFVECFGDLDTWAELAAPVTPVSPANIMHRAFDYQPFREAAKRIDEVIDTASLDEIRIQLRSLSTELKQREPVTPVSGNQRWDGKENWLPQSKEQLQVRNLLRDVACDRITIAEACEKLTPVSANGTEPPKNGGTE